MVFIGLASSATVDAGAVGCLQKLVADLAASTWPISDIVGPLMGLPTTALGVLIAVAAAAAATAAAFPSGTLARVTSLITLLIFVAVNASLLRDRGRAAAVGAPGRTHAAVPANGLACSLGLAGFQVIEFLRGAAGR